ncbi:hypothetical protein [Novipirellula caenicola]|uniref:Uncharacterized protein n=1 Tax=Novipirellula caenicola TaxID=1536901 RepID=A0ABP9VVC8_9BACT
MDLIQGFFAHLLEKRLLVADDQDKGRFRAFLLATLKNFMANDWRHKTTQRRGGHVKTLTINADDFEQQYQESLSDTCTPELLFDRCRVDALLTNVVCEQRAD